MQKSTQADWVTEELGLQEEFDHEKLAIPGIEKLHEKSAQDMGEILALALQMRAIPREVHIVRELSNEAEIKKERISVPGMNILHQKPVREQGEVLALIWKSKPKVVGLHYVPGNYIELATSDGKAGNCSVELVTAKLNR